MSAPKRAAHLGPFDRDKQVELIAFYSRLEQRNIAEHGKDSWQAAQCRRIRHGLETIEVNEQEQLP